MDELLSAVANRFFLLIAFHSRIIFFSFLSILLQCIISIELKFQSIDGEQRVNGHYFIMV